VLDVRTGQITIEEAVLECEREQRLAEASGPTDPQRLGESFEFGYVILGLLEKAGWFVHVTVPLGGQIDGEGTRGVMVLAVHRFADVPPLEVCGRTVADCATPLMVEAGKYLPAIRNAQRRREDAIADSREGGSGTRERDRGRDADGVTEARAR
jgi:hypothetical protein